MRSFIVLTMLWLACAAADMLQLVVEGNGDAVPESLPDSVKAAVVQAFASAEGDSYEFVPPGNTVPATRRNLRATATTALSDHRELDLGCPNACSNSGSTRCWSLGCSYCGRCGRRRLLVSKQRQIEAALNAFLSDICADISSSCSLEAKIMRVSDNGLVSRAT
jgi:hypothetical protein